jgi:hypothetical protein
MKNLEAGARPEFVPKIRIAADFLYPENGFFRRHFAATGENSGPPGIGRFLYSE